MAEPPAAPPADPAQYDVDNLSPYFRYGDDQIAQALQTGRGLYDDSNWQFKDLAAEFRVQLSAQSNAPHWLSARVRAVVAALEI